MARRKKRTLLKKLLVIVAILGVAEVVFYTVLKPANESPSWQASLDSAIDKSKASSDKAGLLKLHLALKAYKTKHGVFPEQLTALIPEFIDSVPADPATNSPYLYVLNNGKYRLGETTKAADSKKKDDKSNEITKDDQEAILAVLRKTDNDGYVYSTVGKKDPFRSYDFTPKEIVLDSNSPLTAYSYDELTLTAVLDGLDEPTANVENSSGKGFTVKVGTKIGNLNGEITKIEKDKITIVETSYDYLGRTKHRTIEMFLR